MSEIDNIITLTGPDGTEIPFEFLDLIQYCGNEYVVLIPADDEDADEVVILQVVSGEDDDTEEYISVENQAILNVVFDIFRERNADEFDFTD